MSPHFLLVCLVFLNTTDIEDTYFAHTIFLYGISEKNTNSESNQKYAENFKLYHHITF